MTDPVADAFIKSIEQVDFRNPWPMHVTQRRMLLAEMVHVEILADTLEAMALRDLADAVLELSIFQGDIPTIEAFVRAKKAYVEIVIASHPL